MCGQTENVNFVVLGVPFDPAAANRTGQRYGPQHVRDFSVLLRPYNPEQDIDAVPGNIRNTYENIEAGLQTFLENDITPIMIDGDHSISLSI